MILFDIYSAYSSSNRKIVCNLCGIENLNILNIPKHFSNMHEEVYIMFILTNGEGFSFTINGMEIIRYQIRPAEGNRWKIYHSMGEIESVYNRIEVWS